MKNLQTPKSEEELAQIVRLAARENSPLQIVGAGTKQTLGNQVTGARVLTTGLSGIEIYEPAALTIVAGAGTPLREIEKALAENNQHLPFEPADYCAILGSTGHQTIGGMVACAVSGPRRIQAGALRDSLIGVRFVNGEGAIIKSGGRVMKNVTGYDLVKLLAGSHGTLGIITQVSFKLLPAPEYTISVNLSGLNDVDAVAAMSAALGSPYDVSGAAHLPDVNGEPITMIRLEGFEKSVRYRAQELTELFSSTPATSIELSQQSQAKSQWQNVRDVATFAETSGALWRLSLKPGDAPLVVRAIARICEFDVFYDWGGGLVWLCVKDENNCAEGPIRSTVDKFGGHATLMRQGLNDSGKNDPVKSVFHPQSRPVEKLSAALRAQFDPQQILNPGRMGI